MDGSRGDRESKAVTNVNSMDMLGDTVRKLEDFVEALRDGTPKVSPASALTKGERPTPTFEYAWNSVTPRANEYSERIMKIMVQLKEVLVGVCLISMLALYGCKGYEQTIKSLKSETIGMNRIITLYDCNGGVIKQWKGNINIDAQQSSFARFILDGKTWQISGIITVEEM